MRGVANEEHPADGEAVGQGAPGPPREHAAHLDVEVGIADRRADDRDAALVREVLGALAGVDVAGDVEDPVRLAVHGRQQAGRLRRGDRAGGERHPPQVGSEVGAEQDVDHRLAQVARPGGAHAERGPHGAVRAVRGHHARAAQRVAAVGPLQFDVDPVGVLRDADQAGRPAQIRSAARQVGRHHGVEAVLRADTAQPERRRVQFSGGRGRHGHGHDVARAHLDDGPRHRLARGAPEVDRDGVDGGVEPELAEDLDGARPDAGGARVDRRPGPAFDEHRGDAVVGEQRRGEQPHAATSDHEHRHFWIRCLRHGYTVARR